MSLPNLEAIDLITQTGDLDAMQRRLAGVETLAVDTESNSLYAYQERVCLIQFSVIEEDFLVDPLALGDLSALGPVFADPRIEKVFHAAEYDLICLRRDFGFEVQNLFDTMLAARILGRNEIGLGSLLEAEFGIKLDKRYQRANWGQRPLPEHLLDYARLDTHHLIPLRDRLRAELAARELEQLAKEDFRRMALTSLNGSEPMTNGDRPVDCWRISGSHDLSPRQAAILLELCRYRDELARQLDRPLFKVMTDQTLMAIASQPPTSLEELRKLPGMSGGQVRRYGQKLLSCVERGSKAAPVHPPRPQRPDPRFSERLDALRDWRKSAAVQMGVPSDVVLPRDLMQDLACKNPRSQQELEQVMKSTPWRLEHFGSQILKALSRH
jgi:ribonuclease D